MPRPQKNELTIEPVYALDPSGNPTNQLLTYRMFGYILGEKIRRRDSDLALLEREKKAHMDRVTDLAVQEKQRNVLTFLTLDQVQMLQGLLKEFPRLTRPFPEYFRAGVAALGDGARVKLTDARDAWEKRMNSPLVKTSDPVRIANLNNLDHFVAFAHVTYLDEIAPEHCRLFLERPIPGKRGRRQAKTQTRLSHGLRLQAFLNFCIKERLLKTNPLHVDLQQMAAISKKERARARILTPAQAGALLDATIEICPQMVPFMVLAIWCFIRPAEIRRLVPADVYLDNKRPVIRLTGEKVGSKSARAVDLPANILGLLRACITTGLWATDETPFYSIAYFNSIRERAGLIKLAEREAGGWRRVLEDGSLWQEHIMRHSGISYHFNKHGDIIDTTRQAGNCPATAFDHYISLPHEGDAEAFYAITRTMKKVVAQSNAQAVA